jgi:tol-pal system protein YbgF
MGMRPSHLLAAALFLLGSALPLSGASAQATSATETGKEAEPSPADVAKRLQRVEEQIVDLSAQLGTVESMSHGAGGQQPADAAQSGGAGGDETRLGQIEAEIRALSAQMSDIGRRLQQIEGRSGAVSSSEQAGGGAAPTDANSQPAGGRRIAAQPAEQGTGFSIGGDGTAPSGSPDTVQQPAPSDGFGSTATEPIPAEPKPAKKKSSGGLFGLFGGSEEEEEPARPAKPQTIAPQTQEQPGQSDAGAAGGPVRVAALSTPQAKSLYDSAYGYLMQSNYRAAADGFEQFVQRFPADPLAGSAHYWLGEAAFMNGEYRRAADNFLKSTTNYPQSEKAAESMLKLGISLKRLNENDAACSSFNELARRYPDATNVLQRAEAEKRRAKCSS